MQPTFIQLWFNQQNSFYYLHGLTNTRKQERPKVLFGDKDVELYNWLVTNVGPAHGPLDNLPCSGDGWNMVGSQSTIYPYEEFKQKSGVYIDDEMMAVQLKCSGILDDRPEDPIAKMVREMAEAMTKYETEPFKFPVIKVDSLGPNSLTPVSGKRKYRAEDFNVFFPKSK